MTTVKPKADHPWRTGMPINKELQKFIKESGTSGAINNWKVGGGAPAWNGRK